MAITLAIGVAALVVSSKLRIPFFPVPMTMQPLVVLLIGMAYGPRLGGSTVLTFLGLGAVGFPVFAGAAAGIPYILGPTGGYLFGFFIAAVATGWLAERGADKSMLATLGAMALGLSLIYIPGLLWLGSIIGWDKPILALGLTPFLLGDAVKIGLATLLLPQISKRLRRETR